MIQFNPELIKLARESIARLREAEKQAFVPMSAAGPAADPSQGGPPGMPPGGPPGMPPGAPPMDPSQMGGMPPGAPPMDPSQMGGMPPGAEQGGPPPEQGQGGPGGGQVVQMNMDDLVQLVIMLTGGGQGYCG